MSSNINNLKLNNHDMLLLSGFIESKSNNLSTQKTNRISHQICTLEERPQKRLRLLPSPQTICASPITSADIITEASDFTPGLDDEKQKNSTEKNVHSEWEDFLSQFDLSENSDQQPMNPIEENPYPPQQNGTAVEMEQLCSDSTFGLFDDNSLLPMPTNEPSFEAQHLLLPPTTEPETHQPAPFYLTPSKMPDQFSSNFFSVLFKTTSAPTSISSLATEKNNLHLISKLKLIQHIVYQAKATHTNLLTPRNFWPFSLDNLIIDKQNNNQWIVQVKNYSIDDCPSEYIFDTNCLNHLEMSQKDEIKFQCIWIVLTLFKLLETDFENTYRQLLTMDFDLLRQPGADLLEYLHFFENLQLDGDHRSSSIGVTFRFNELYAALTQTITILEKIYMPKKARLNFQTNGRNIEKIKFNF